MSYYLLLNRFHRVLPNGKVQYLVFHHWCDSQVYTSEFALQRAGAKAVHTES